MSGILGGGGGGGGMGQMLMPLMMMQMMQSAAKTPEPTQPPPLLNPAQAPAGGVGAGVNRQNLPSFVSSAAPAVSSGQKALKSLLGQ